MLDLDPVKAKFELARIVDEVVLRFTAKPSAKVKISAKIQAEDATGFDDSTQRAVRENCNVLDSSSAEFEGTDPSGGPAQADTVALQCSKGTFFLFCGNERLPR
jgi:hypothetical protein